MLRSTLKCPLPKETDFPTLSQSCRRTPVSKQELVMVLFYQGRGQAHITFQSHACKWEITIRCTFGLHCS